jgi:hypothetical protein
VPYLVVYNAGELLDAKVGVIHKLDGPGNSSVLSDIHNLVGFVRK